MSDETRYTIGDLADAAGVTPRTIRYYTAEGLLPPPDARGRHALYGSEHLSRLLLIARLKDAYLPLGEIKARLDQLTHGQVEALLDEYRQAPQAPAPSSAADYIAQVLTAQAAPPAPRMLSEPPANYVGGASPPAPAAMVGFRPPAAPAAPAAPDPPAAPPPIGRAEPATQSAASGGLLRKLIPQRRERAETAQAADAPQPDEAWRRVPLAPGVELHLREPPAPALRERVERLIALARELFDVPPGGE